MTSEAIVEEQPDQGSAAAFTTDQKVRIITNHLMDGGAIVINGITYGMSEDNDLCFRGVSGYARTPLETTDEVWLNTDISLRAYIKLCDSVSDIEMMVTIGRRVLEQHRNSKY